MLKLRCLWGTVQGPWADHTLSHTLCLGRVCKCAQCLLAVFMACSHRGWQWCPMISSVSSVSSSGPWELFIAIASKISSSWEPPCNASWSACLASGSIYSQLFLLHRRDFALTVTLVAFALSATSVGQPQRSLAELQEAVHSSLSEGSKPAEYHAVLYKTAILSAFLFIS